MRKTFEIIYRVVELVSVFVVDVKLFRNRTIKSFPYGSMQTPFLSETQVAVSSDPKSLFFCHDAFSGGVNLFMSTTTHRNLKAFKNQEVYQ